MGITNPPIAETLNDYASLAIELGQNGDWLHTIKEEINDSSKNLLFSDRRFLKEFETFLLAAVDAAENGKKLPEGWAAIT